MRLIWKVISSARDLVGCACDNEARQLVSQMADGHPMELWHGARLVERFAPAAGDRESWLYSHELRKQASDRRKAL